MEIEIEGINYHVELRGAGKPLLCLHGFSENLSTWDGFNPENHQLILVDWIGHGGSARPEARRDYHWNVMIRHLHQLIRRLGYDRYSMLGYSMGGRLALAYALTYPAGIEKLVLESASYGEEGIIKRFKRRRSDARLAKAIRKKGIGWFNQYWSGLSLFASQSKLPADLLASIRERRLANTPYALANTLWGSGQGKMPCFKGRISQLSMPVLYISGQNDGKYTGVGAVLRGLNRGITQEIMAGAGHNTHVEAPQAFQAAVKSFLEGALP